MHLEKILFCMLLAHYDCIASLQFMKSISKRKIDSTFQSTASSRLSVSFISSYEAIKAESLIMRLLTTQLFDSLNIREILRIYEWYRFAASTVFKHNFGELVTCNLF